MGRQKERKSEAWEEEIIKEEETGGIRGGKSKFVGGKYREGDECKGEEKGINESGKNGEVEVEGEGEEKTDEEEGNCTEDEEEDMEVEDEDKEEDGE